MDKIITVEIDINEKIYLVMNDSTKIDLDRDKKTLQQNFLFNVDYCIQLNNPPGKLTYDQFIEWLNSNVNSKVDYYDKVKSVDNINNLYFIRLIKK